MQKQRPPYLSALLGMLLLLISVPVWPQVIDSPAAIVRLHTTTNISKRELAQVGDLLAQQQRTPLTQEQRQALLDAEIDSELIRQDAEKMNIRVSDSELESSIERQRQSLAPNATESQFRSLLEQQTSLSWTEYQTQVKERLIQEKYIVNLKRDKFLVIEQPTQKEIEAFYDQNATRFTNPAIIQVDYLLIVAQNVTSSERERLRGEAQKLYNTATQSVSAFEKAKRDSLDDPSYRSAQQLLLRGNQAQETLLGENFISEAFAIDENKFAPRVLTSKLGFHIVRVVDKRAPKVLKLTDPVLPGQSVTVNDQIRNLLRSQNQQKIFTEAVQEITSELRTKADIRTFPNSLEW